MKDVTAALIQLDGRVLITRRASFEKHAGKWEFPGGKVESGETPEQCLKRELFEELGIETFVGEFFAESQFEYATGSIRLLAFWVSIGQGEIVLTVHDQFQWVNVDDLLTYDLLPADIPIAAKMKEDHA